MSQIHQELQTLKSELDKLETVRQNFETAREVTKSIVEQLATQSQILHEHIGNVIPIYDKHLQENLKQTQDKLVLVQKSIEKEVNEAVLQWIAVANDYQTGLSNHIQAIQKQLNDSQKSIEDKANETSKRWKDVADVYNTSLAEHLEKLQNEFEKSGKGIQKNVSDATIPIFDLNKHIESLLASLVSTHKQIEKLTNKNELLVDEIRKIDFPSRLDKIDNTVSAINLGLQNVQSRVSDSERNIKETVSNVEKNLLNQISILESKANSAKIFQWITLFLLLVVMAMLVAIYIKR